MFSRILAIASIRNDTVTDPISDETAIRAEIQVISSPAEKIKIAATDIPIMSVAQAKKEMTFEIVVLLNRCFGIYFPS